MNENEFIWAPVAIMADNFPGSVTPTNLMGQVGLLPNSILIGH